MDLPEDRGRETVEAQPHRETSHDPPVNAHYLDRASQPGEGATDQHGTDRRPVAVDASKKSKSFGLSRHTLFVARFGTPQVQIDGDHGEHCNDKSHTPFGTGQK